jgi:hypothetical protein
MRQWATHDNRRQIASGGVMFSPEGVPITAWQMAELIHRCPDVSKVLA